MNDVRDTTHRADQGQSYRTLDIHAAPGVHEHALDMCRAVLSHGARILEVGAGSGALTLRLQDAGFEVVATDLEPNQPWIHALNLDDPTATAAVAGRFDMIVCVETMEHLENPRAALRLMRSLLDPGAQLLVSTPNVTHPHSRLKTLFDGAPWFFGTDAYYDTGHITPLPDWLLVEHLRSTGFEDIHLERAGDSGISSRIRTVAHRVEHAVLWLVGVRQPVEAGDGCCLFALATAP